MKFLILLVALAGLCCLGQADSDADLSLIREFVNNLIKECKAETNPSQEDINSLNNRKAPTSENGKCFCGCVVEKLGYLHDNKFIKSKLEERIKVIFAKNPEKGDKALEYLTNNCESKLTPNNKCEFGAQLLGCFGKMPQMPNWNW